MMTVTGMNFVCRGDKGVEIPREIIQSGGFEFPAVHNSSSEMCRLAREIKLFRQSNFCMLPFCSTVEAEALGGIVNMGSESSGPRISSFTFDSMDQLKELKNMDFESGRIKEVLDAVELLRQSGEIVSLNVGGPFTVIASLIDPVVFYKAIKKNRAAVEDVLKMVEDNILRYSLEGIKRGARIISYADAVGTADLVGPKIYKDIAGKASIQILKGLKDSDALDNSIIHVCGKTSVSLEKHGFITSAPIELKAGKNYGEAVLDILNNESARIIGHFCIKRINHKLKNPIAWGIELNGQYL